MDTKITRAEYDTYVWPLAMAYVASGRYPELADAVCEAFHDYLNQMRPAGAATHQVFDGTSGGSHPFVVVVDLVDPTAPVVRKPTP